ncbi:MAG: cytochrome c [Betaproteobacteria bacterium]|nr:cytochrome c [Betaproteobacteria bacterium]
MPILRSRDGVRVALLAGAIGVCVPLASAQSFPGDCPQARLTQSAPPEYLAMRNPLAGTDSANAEGRALFNGHAETDACTLCHGKKGDGNGRLAKLYEPLPRNFACANTMGAISDGQLFWIIRYGSPNTGMPPHRDLSDKQVWQLVSFVRELARAEGKSR